MFVIFFAYVLFAIIFWHLLTILNITERMSNEKIIISINPTHVKNILSGVKKFEYRTKVAKKNIQSIIVYCTYPIMKIISEIEVKSIISDTFEKLWEITKNNSGITKKFSWIILIIKKSLMRMNLGK